MLLYSLTSYNVGLYNIVWFNLELKSKDTAKREKKRILWLRVYVRSSKRYAYDDIVQLIFFCYTKNVCTTLSYLDAFDGIWPSLRLLTIWMKLFIDSYFYGISSYLNISYFEDLLRLHHETMGIGVLLTLKYGVKLFSVGSNFQLLVH